MAEHSRQGYSLLPIGGGKEGKAPLLALKGPDYALKQVSAVMQTKGSRAFAIRADDLVIVDLDTINEATIKYAKERFGEPSYRVDTDRGEHWYYRDVGNPIPSKKIRENGISIDIKAGRTSYVLAAGSVRADGKRYRAVGRLLAPDELNPFRDRKAIGPSVARANGKIPKGSRNEEFVKWLVAGITIFTDLEEAYLEAVSYRDYHFENPESYPDNEVLKQVKWAWGLRVSGRLYAEKPIVPVPTVIGKALIKRGMTDEFALYFELIGRGGFDRNKRLEIVPKKLRVERAIGDWGLNRYDKAKHSLIDLGLLSLVRKAQKSRDDSGKCFTDPALYRLITDLPPSLRE